MGRTWIVAVRHYQEEWKQIGTTKQEPAEELVPDLLRAGGHVAPRNDEMFSAEGLEVRFIPVHGGDPRVFRARYVLEVTEQTVDEAEAAALPDLDSRLRDDEDDFGAAD